MTDTKQTQQKAPARQAAARPTPLDVKRMSERVRPQHAEEGKGSQQGA
jgi:hypothetical protein